MDLERKVAVITDGQKGVGLVGESIFLILFLLSLGLLPDIFRQRAQSLLPVE